MRILVVGDTHGHAFVIKKKITFAKVVGADRLLIVGDFGLWPGYEGVDFLDAVNAAARENNIKVFVLPGNHEDHDQWERILKDAPKDDSGFAYARSHILLSPKVLVWKWAGKRFSIAGGAVSIDRRWRKEGVSYWRNETFSEQNLASVMKYQGPAIDFMFSHDASNYTPWGFQLVPDADSQENRRRLDEAIRVWKPRFHFHGHMHKKFEWENYYNGADYPTLTFGLDCDGEKFSFGLLDTDDEKFYWPGEASGRFAS